MLVGVWELSFLQLCCWRLGLSDLLRSVDSSQTTDVSKGSNICVIGMVEQSKKSTPLKFQYLFTTRLGETTNKIWTLTEDSAYLLTYLMGRQFVLFTICLLLIFKNGVSWEKL